MWIDANFENQALAYFFTFVHDEMVRQPVQTPRRTCHSTGPANQAGQAFAAALRSILAY